MDTTLGRHFTRKEKQTFGGGRKPQRIPRRVETVMVEYEIVSEVLMSLVGTKFVWAKTLNGKNVGKDIPWPISDLPKIDP